MAGEVGGDEVRLSLLTVDEERERVLRGAIKGFGDFL